VPRDTVNVGPDLLDQPIRMGDKATRKHLKSRANAFIGWESMKPTGSIRDSLTGHWQLARRYHDFLQSVQPAETWSDVGTLADPIPPKAEYPIDWELVSRWAAACPSLAGVMSSVRDYDLMAPCLGWNYAWTRFPQHLYLLDAIEEMIGTEAFKPTIVLEPGCFTGGFLHFLADHWDDVPCIGFDVSPVSLDVCSRYSDRLQQKNRPLWLEADFSQIQPGHLPDQLGEHIEGGLVILCNVIECLGKTFNRYPYLEMWTPRSLLISYWVNQGATVLLNERHDDPPLLRDSILERAHWEKPGCTAEVMAQFTVPITNEMVPGNPLGNWQDEKGCVIRFSPPKEKPKKRR
jgi:SAM-dependent methyltransferase